MGKRAGDSRFKIWCVGLADGDCLHREMDIILESDNPGFSIWKNMPLETQSMICIKKIKSHGISWGVIKKFQDFQTTKTSGFFYPVIFQGSISWKLCSHDFLILGISQDFPPTSLDWNDLIFHDNVKVHWQSRSILHPFK